MKTIGEMTQIEMAAFIQTCLEKHSIHVTLSGGAATGFYSQNQYISADIDLVNDFSVDRKKIEKPMLTIGFTERGRYFVHPESVHLVEFPPGPLTVGLEPVKKIEIIELDSGGLRIISATDCVKDRLAAFYHWQDEQCLYQARLVTKNTNVDLSEVERWSRHEGKIADYYRFRSEL
jgi:hypothetical protein